MNKAIQKMMVALAVCGALCGTSMAAQKRISAPHGERAPAAARADNMGGRVVRAPERDNHRRIEQPRQERRNERPEPRRETAQRHRNNPPPRPAARPPEPRREVVVVHHQTPPPPPPPPAPRHHEEHRRPHHDDSTLHTEDWCTIGASLVGGLIGGIIGAAL